MQTYAPSWSLLHTACMLLAALTTHPNEGRSLAADARMTTHLPLPCAVTLQMASMQQGVAPPAAPAPSEHVGA